MTRLAIALSLLATIAFAPACNEATGEPTPDAQEQESAFVNFEATPPISFSGDFRFSNRVFPLGRLTTDVINMQMPGAAELLAELQASGAACQLVLSNTWRCKKMHGPEAVPQSSLDALGDKDDDLFVNFGPVTAPPALVNDAPSLKEWQIFQTGSSSLGPFTGYRYLQLEGGLAKVIVEAPTGSDSLEFVVRDSTRLSKHETKNVTDSQWRFHQDLAFVVFSP
jgi:hypothetical protein